MIDSNKLWSCVGSAGTVDPADIGKVVFAGSVVQMPGVVIGPVEPGARVSVPPRPQAKAVIRYSVTPVDGVALQSKPLERYALRVVARTGSGGVHVRFLQVPMITGPATQIGETALIDFPLQDGFAAAGFNVFSSVNVSAPELDFVNNSYYVEITLNEAVGGLDINPPGVALIQLAPTTRF